MPELWAKNGEIMQLDAIGIVSKDMKKSIKFYSMLGLKFTKSSNDHFEAKTKSGVRLMLDSVSLMKKLNPKWTKPKGQAMALGFNFESPKKVDAAFNKITKAGFKFKTKPWDAFWGQRYATVVDPDGNHIDLFAQL